MGKCQNSTFPEFSAGTLCIGKDEPMGAAGLLQQRPFVRDPVSAAQQASESWWQDYKVLPND